VSRVDDRIAELAPLEPSDLDRFAAFYLENSGVPFDCEERLTISDRLRDVAELKRIWALGG
jgi:DNA-binding transcriptional regulator/RsmH inhibitor MraZ